MKIKQKYLLLVVVVIIAVAVFYFVRPRITGRQVEPEPEDKVTNFAKCLSENDVVMYGTKYCGHCDNQKKLFGEAFEHVNYVECTEQTAVCQEKGVQYVPAWEIGGELYVGEKTFETLATLSGCPFE